MSNNTNPPQTDGLDPDLVSGCADDQIWSNVSADDLRASLTPDKRDEEIERLTARNEFLETALRTRVWNNAKRRGLSDDNAIEQVRAALTHTDKGE